MSVADLTLKEKLLLAAEQLENEGQSPFSDAALVMAAWQRFPETFGLNGYPAPDSHKCLYPLMGKNGLRNRGYLRQTAPKTYALTPEGRLWVRRALGQAEEPKPAGRLQYDDEAFLTRLFESEAARLMNEGRKGELTFSVACRFWGLKEGSAPAVVDKLLSATTACLRSLAEDLEDAPAQFASGRVVTAADLRLLGNVHGYLLSRFSRQLDLMRRN